MKAHVGDHIVVTAPTTGGAVRDGVIEEVRGAEGGPPYVVRWSQGGTGLFYPGSDAHIAAGSAAPPTGTPEAPPARHARSWRVEIDLYEADDDTTAHAVLVAEPARRVDASGAARRNPADTPVAVIGDEIAVARALRHLSDRLLATASEDISGAQGDRVDIDA
jgi:hypothetical protein